eukprot:CRZ05982.1 hypothetical protein [Spongospora subterranea]
MMFFLVLALYCFELSDGGNTNSMPVISQAKSACQAAFGDLEGAAETQRVFLNTCPIVSQAKSAAQAMLGDPDAARETQMQFVKNLEQVAEATPGIGYITATVHYACGNAERGNEVMEKATRNTIVVSAAVLGGPVGALVASQAIDLTKTAIDSIKNGEYTPHDSIGKIGKKIQNEEPVSGDCFDLVFEMGSAVKGVVKGNAGNMKLSSSIPKAYAGASSPAAKTKTKTSSSPGKTDIKASEAGQCNNQVVSKSDYGNAGGSSSSHKSARPEKTLSDPISSKTVSDPLVSTSISTTGSSFTNPKCDRSANLLDSKRPVCDYVQLAQLMYSSIETDEQQSQSVPVLAAQPCAIPSSPPNPYPSGNTEEVVGQDLHSNEPGHSDTTTEEDHQPEEEEQCNGPDDLLFNGSS